MKTLFNLCYNKSGDKYEFCHKALDEKLEKLKKQGKIVPNKKLIKSQKQI